MTTPELNFATPTELLAALPHLLGIRPRSTTSSRSCSAPSPDPKHIPMRAAIRCPITID